MFFRRTLQQADQDQITADGAALTGTTPTVATATTTRRRLFQDPIGDTRRGAANSNDLRGKILRIKVKDTMTAADFNKADLGAGSGAYTIPAGNLFPLVGGQAQAKTRPEVYAMGFRNPFRLQVDENDVAYVTDYSPDSNTQQRSRGPAGTGRYEIVRKAANYGWPTCYSSASSAYYKWNFSEFAPGTTTAGIPLNNPPQAYDCDGGRSRSTTRAGCATAARASSPACASCPR